VKLRGPLLVHDVSALKELVQQLFRQIETGDYERALDHFSKVDAAIRALNPHVFVELAEGDIHWLTQLSQQFEKQQNELKSASKQLIVEISQFKTPAKGQMARSYRDHYD
jgi:hypothetical protein